jgi:hypothetical protein
LANQADTPENADYEESILANQGAQSIGSPSSHIPEDPGETGDENDPDTSALTPIPPAEAAALAAYWDRKGTK